MSAEMHLLVLKHTGHILAAVAPSAAPSGPSVDELIGPDLPVRSSRQTVTGLTAAIVLQPKTMLVPATMIEVKTVARDFRILSAPHEYAVDGGRPVLLPPPTRTVQTGAGPVSTPRVGPTTITEARFERDGGAPGVNIAVILSERDKPASQRRAQTGTFDPQGKAVLAHAILPGAPAAQLLFGRTYWVLVANGGMQIEWLTLVL